MKSKLAVAIMVSVVAIGAAEAAYGQEKPKFSSKRGFYSSAFSLTLSTDDSTATIRYTLDCSTPSSTAGTVYAAPISISKTSVVRAIALYTDGTASEVATNTYVFVADVITQCSSGAAPNSSWPAANASSSAGQLIDYGMDPDVVNSTTYSGLVDDALLALPTISMVTDLPNLFNKTTGIYMNPREDGSDWERPVSLELIYPSGKDGFQINAGARIRGGVSRDTTNPKHAFRLFFRSEYGSARLEFPLFGNEGAESFDKLDLRTEQNYSWSKEGSSKNTMVREVFSRDTQRDMGHPYTRSRYYHLYLDGLYWGIYQTQERAEASYAETYFGSAEENYDVIKVDSSTHQIEATDGTTAAWQELWQAATTGFTTDARYYAAQGMNSSGVADPTYKRLVDIDNLIDYMTIIYYTGDHDAPISAMLQNQSPNNFYAIIDRLAPNGFTFFTHDAECTMLTTTEDRTGPFSTGSTFSKFNPQWLFQRLASHPEFCMRFADRVQKHLYNGGVLTTDAASARFLGRANEIDTAIIAESARWGDAKSSRALTRDTDWLPAINYVVDTFFTARVPIVISQFRARGWFPTINAPTVALNGVTTAGGAVQSGDTLTLSASTSYIYYTLSGVDPRVRVSVSKDDSASSKAVGAVSSQAIRYTGAIPITQTTTHILARAYSGTEWSALTELTFVTGDPVNDLRVTEVMYHPPDAPDGNPDAEFIELKNIGTEPIGLTGIKFTNGVLSTLTEGELAPGAFALVVADKTAFESVYGTGLPVYGVYTGRLDNGGETLRLETSAGAAIQEFEYNDTWYPTTDGVGYSLTINEPSTVDTATWSVVDNWHASLVWGGTPGADEAAGTAPTAAFSASATSGAAPLAVTFTDTSTPGTAEISSRQWSFGDGGTSTEQNPSHTYTSAGTYTVSLTVTSSAGSDTESKTAYITVMSAPSVAFSASTTTGTAPLAVNFTDASSPNYSAITSWSWSFGDGSTSAERNPAHTYTAAGSHTVSLTATNAIGGNTTTKEGYITVAATPVAPTAAFSASVTTGTVPLSVAFTDTSTPGTASISSRLWSFGDGSTSTEQNPTHNYTAAGTYTVSLTVTTSVGSDVETKSGYIVVSTAPPTPTLPTAAFVASTTSGYAPLAVGFTDTSLPGTATITAWAWSFGDGTTSSERNPSHTYSAVGTYSVSLTVTTSVGSDIETKTSYISVSTAPVAPTAAFNASVTTGSTPLSVSFADASVPGTSPITSWAWSFGDGVTSTAQNPTHVYSLAGIYTVALTVTTAAGSDAETKSNLITAIAPPAAAFAASATTGVAPLTVVFTDTSTAGGASITSRSWSFGDGTTSTVANPTHLYGIAGVYTVSLTVYTAVGADTETKTNYITVATPPSAAFAASTTAGAAPMSVTFTDTSSAGSSAITSRLWSFGDGSTSATQNPTHTYTSAGSYTVSLTVSTAVGNDIETKSNYITVTTAPNAAFTVAPATGSAPLSVAFTDTSSAGSSPITTWTWDFGDGATSTERNPIHTYEAEGSYTVSLTVATSIGNDTETKANCVVAAAASTGGCFAGAADGKARTERGDLLAWFSAIAGLAAFGRRRGTRCGATEEGLDQ